MKFKNLTKVIVVMGSAALAGSAFAGAHSSGDGKGKREMGQYSGYEGKEVELGNALLDAVKEAGEAVGKDYDFSDRPEELGAAIHQTLKTLNHNDSYQHEMNDALVKMTMGHIQFGKDNDMLEEIVAQDIEVTSPMMKRVGKMIEKTGNKELALTAIFDQTTCFYQLVTTADREPGKVRYKSPFMTLVPITNAMGQYDLSAEEIHEVWTKPRYQGYAEILGVDLDVSDIDEDGYITVQLSPVS